MRALIVIPTYNEVENISSLLEQVLSLTPAHVEILVVDDGSPDGTGLAVQKTAQAQPRVHLLSRSGKLGLGTAYVAGFKWGIQQGFDQLIEMDADFSHNPQYLSTMLELLRTHDFVIGSRYVADGGTVNWGLGRKILSRGGSLYARMILGISIRDFTGGFNGWNRKVLQSIDLDTLRSDGYSFQIELKYRAAKAGFRNTEFPILFEDRKVGKSKMNKRIVFEALRRVWQLRFRSRPKALPAALLCLAILLPMFAKAAPAPTVILVDKSENSLKVAEYGDQQFKILKTYRTTVGKVKGDKEEQDDLKTPEGIYFFTSHLKPPSIKPKFGAMAFYMNYPNPYDRLAGRTGFDIMLHATNEPERLKKDFDSEGCVVVKNEEIEEIQHHIRLNLTPIMVFQEMKEEYLKPSSATRLKQFFQNWMTAWENKQIEPYMAAYHTEFNGQGKNRSQWRAHKENLNKNYATIKVSPEKILYFRHPKYSVVMFVQNYQSTLKGGGAGHRSRGTKTLWIGEENGEYKILDEDFTQMTL